MSTFGSLLRQHRERADISQVKLAALAMLDKSHVSRLEAGERNPTRETVEQLALALDLYCTETDQLLLAAGFATVTPATISEVRQHLTAALALMGGG